MIETLLNRRSVLAKNLMEPGPNQDEISQILAAGHRVPDHGKLGPWRFMIFEGDARISFGQVLREAFSKNNPCNSDAQIKHEETRFLRAPLIICVVSSPVESKVPEWEQVLSAGAVCQNILHAAHVLGFGAQWLTEWYAYDDFVHKALALTSTEKIAGFMYIGSTNAPTPDRIRPALEERLQYWKG